MTASPPTPPTGELVLCVDLDGTLLRGDTLLDPVSYAVVAAMVLLTALAR